MMRWIVASSMRFRLLVLLVAAGVMLAGIIQLLKTPVEALPEFGPPYVEIQTEALGLSAEEVEQLITVPMEADLLNGLPWLDVIRSESLPGLSSVTLVFERGTDIMRARQLVAERLTQAAVGLPNVSKPPTMLPPLSSASRVLMFGLSSDKLSNIELSVLARWTLRPRLMGVPGVANVSIWGQRDQQLQVRVNPAQLHDHGVSISQVVSTTGNALQVSPLTFLEASTPGTAGFIDTPNQRLGIRHVLPIVTPKELAQVPIEDAHGLRLGDVSRVDVGHPLMIGDALVGNGSGLMLVVEKFPGANTLEVTRGVEAALDALRPGLSGVDLGPTVFRPGTYVEAALGNLGLALLIGAALVVIVICAFLFAWRTILISLVTIPLSLATAWLALSLRGATVNMLVLAGLVLAIGIIVDDAIADVDTIARRFGELRRENGDQPAARTIVEASLEVRRPVVYATLIVVLAVVPVLFMESLSAAFFRPLAVSYLVAVLASMLVALTVTPVLALTLLSRKSPGRRESPLVARIQRGYGGALSRLGRRPALSFVAAGVILVLGLAAWPLIGQSLFPSFKERNLLINWDGPPGTSLPEQRRITTQAIGELRSLPGVSDASAHIGRAVMSDQLVNVNSGEIWVDVDPAADYDSTVASVQRVVAGYPGLSHDVETYESERVNEVLTKTRAPLVVRIYGDDLGVLNRQANRMRNVLAGIDGVVDPRVENMPEEPTLAIKLSLPAAQRYGLTPGDVRRETATLLSGITVGSLFEQQKVFDVQVWGTSPTRHSVTSVRRLRIETPDGGRVALGKVAQVRLRPQPTVIRREAVSRYIDVTAGVSGQQDPASVAAAVDRRLHGMSLPLEYRAELLGRFSGRESVPNRLLPTAAAAAVGIFLLLQAAFASWRLALLLFATLVVAAAGGMVAAWMAGGTLSLGSLFGFLAVLGITARASLLLIGRYRYLEEHGSQRAGPNVVLQGAGERLGPVVAASLATVLAFVPFLVLGDVAGLEIVQPMAVVVMGGLLTALLLNLFILPIAYLRFGSRPTAGTGGK